MKKLLLTALLFVGTIGLKAEETAQKEGTPLKEVVNTLKERITLQGYIQVGYSYDDRSEKNNSFNVNRAILMARGQITDRWSCYFMYSFAGTGKILEAYTEYQFLPGLTARLGQFKTQYSLENPLSSTVTELIDCYSQAVSYLIGNNNPLSQKHGGRDIGLLIYGNLFHKFATYNLAIMNGQGLNQKDANNQKDIVGSLYIHPVKGLTIGGSFIQGKGNAANLSGYNPSIQAGENFTRNRWAVSASFKSKPIDIRSEYLAGKDGQVKIDGYYCTANLHLLPKFDFIASYDYINRNKYLSDKQSNYVAGIQYWFYPKCRLQAQYTYRNPKSGENSNLFQAQIQVRF